MRFLHGHLKTRRVSGATGRSQIGRKCYMDNLNLVNKELLDDVWVDLILCAREMGFSLEDIRSVLNDLQEAGDAYSNGEKAI